MNCDTGKSASIRLSTQLLYFMDYKIHEYSPEELYENKARLFESLMLEWNNMSANQQEKFCKKVQFTNGGEKAKQHKDESNLESLYETAVEKYEQGQQLIIEEKNERNASSNEIQLAEIIKEKKNNIHNKYSEEQKQEPLISNQEFSEKESNSQQPQFKSQKSLINQQIEEHHVDANINQINQKDENIKQENEIDEQKNNLRIKNLDVDKKRSQKGTIEKIKSKRSSIQKRALSPSKQIQLEQQKNHKYFFIDETLTLKQLKEQIKNLLKQNE
ncbi:unnamed protein product [Paramecium primaurelia]|uniref:Uncharacterized protein n=1 Tax=Paramecium primaurelia TaxID=5886 RepID=A0A8S1L5D5_PARPR|nr:unnamed protein product [Paramecium primaurelia]